MHGLWEISDMHRINDTHSFALRILTSSTLSYICSLNKTPWIRHNKTNVPKSAASVKWTTPESILPVRCQSLDTGIWDSFPWKRRRSTEQQPDSRSLDSVTLRVSKRAFHPQSQRPSASLQISHLLPELQLDWLYKAYLKAWGVTVREGSAGHLREDSHSFTFK